jgi:hypothetical protein
MMQSVEALREVQAIVAQVPKGLVFSGTCAALALSLSAKLTLFDDGMAACSATSASELDQTHGEPR